MTTIITSPFKKDQVVRIIGSANDPSPAKLEMVGGVFTIEEVVEVEVKAYGIRSRADGKMYYFLAGDITK